MVRIGALGPIICAPIFVILFGKDLPALFPTLDLFLVPFMAQQASIVDEMMVAEGIADEDDVFLATCCALSGIGLILAGLLNILASKVRGMRTDLALKQDSLCAYLSDGYCRNLLT